MTEAKSREGLVECIVTGKKRMSANNPDTGEVYFAQPGDTVWVQPHTAKTFAHCLSTPAVAKAQQAAVEAQEKAIEAKAVENDPKPAEKTEEERAAERAAANPKPNASE